MTTTQNNRTGIIPFTIPLWKGLFMSIKNEIDKQNEEKNFNDKRKSYCNLCGKRVSFKDEKNVVRFEGHYVTSNGMYCIECYKPQ